MKYEQKMPYQIDIRAFNAQTKTMFDWETQRGEVLKALMIGGQTFIFSQWIGQFDMNGRKIYTGDICKAKIINEFGSIIWRIGLCKYHPQCGAYHFEFGEKIFQEENADSITVVGDCFRNPEILQSIKENGHITYE